MSKYFQAQKYPKVENVLIPPYYILPLMLGNILTRKAVMKAGKGVVRAGIGYNNIDYMSKNSRSAPSF